VRQTNLLFLTLIPFPHATCKVSLPWRLTYTIEWGSYESAFPFLPYGYTLKETCSKCARQSILVIRSISCWEMNCERIFHLVGRKTCKIWRACPWEDSWHWLHGSSTIEPTSLMSWMVFLHSQPDSIWMPTLWGRSQYSADHRLCNIELSRTDRPSWDIFPCRCWWVSDGNLLALSPSFWQYPLC